jgi:thiosulfate/3-mercaptopyruvate sulfurtransferase
MGERTMLLDGQLPLWRDEGRPVTAQEPSVEPSDWTPKLNPRVVTHLRTVRDASWAATSAPGAPVSLVDARPPEEYSGEEPGTDVLRPGHIPGAAGIFWEQHLLSMERPLMKPKDELRRLYTAAGVQPADIVITYCRTGGQASHAYFTAKYLGHPTYIYDGSYIEWQAREDTVVREGTAP